MIVERIPSEIIMKSRRLLAKVGLETKIDDILEIIEETYKKHPCRLSGKKSVSLLSGLIYIIAKQNGQALTQKTITKTLGCHEVTVRSSYYFWMDLLNASA